jgi:predicted PurR-regulated permease PerM
MIDDKVGDWYSKPPMMNAPPGLGVLGVFVIVIMTHIIWILTPILLPVVLVSLILYSVWEIMNNLVEVLREIIKVNKVELTRTASIRLIAVFIAYATILKVYMAEVAKKNESKRKSNIT